MKFLYVGDLHQDELIPIHRMDDFNETRKEKISEILKIAKDNNVNAILHGGDFFNRPKMSNEFVTSIIETWNEQLISIDIQELTFQFKAGIISEKEYLQAINQYKQNTIPFISIIGNHDLIGDNIESYPKTSLNVLETSGFLHIVDKENPIIFKENDLSVAITGFHYDRELDKSQDKLGYIVDKKVEVDGKPCDYQIHLTHGMLTPISYGKKFAHTTISEIQDKTIADLTINGHDHIGFDTIYYKDKIFANPGSPFRLTADKKEIDRMPKVLLISISKKGIEVEDIYLQCAKKGDLVLSEDAKITNKNKISTMAKIQTMINQSSLQKSLRIADIIDNIGNASNIDKDILKDVQNKIIESMNLLQPSFSPSGEYYITRLELENFLSHKNSAFDFQPGLNILSGESRSGKSAVLRALREVLTCYITQPREAIFFGASYFSITIYTSNGYIVTRKVEKDEKKGFNGYEIYDPKTSVFTKYNTKAVSLVQEILGYIKIPLTEKKSIDVNSVIQGDGWFYIGNNITAPDRARLLGVVYGTHYADAANKEIASNIKRNTTHTNLVKKEKERLELQKNDYKYLTNLEINISNSETLIEDLEKKEVELQQIKSLYSNLQNMSMEINKLKQLQQTLSFNVSSIVIDLKTQLQTLTTSIEKYNLMVNIVNEGRIFRPIQNSLKNISISKNTCKELKDLEKTLKEDKEKYNLFVSFNNQKENIEKELNSLNLAKNNLNNVANASSLLKDLKQEELDLIEFKNKANQVLNYQKILENLKNQINQNKNSLDSFKSFPNINDLNALKNKELKLQKMKELLTSLTQLEQEKKQQRDSLLQINQDNLNKIDLYKQELEKVGTCPICHSEIDNVLINKLVEQHLDKLRLEKV